MEPKDTMLSLNKKTTKFIQDVTMTFLFYALAIDSTMFTALSVITREQAKPTRKTFMKIK